MTENKFDKISKLIAILSLLMIVAVVFYAGFLTGQVISNKPQNTWSPDTNSIVFRRSIQVDGNIYVKGKIYNYKEK